MRADPHIGLLHRGTEKLIEYKTYTQVFLNIINLYTGIFKYIILYSGIFKYHKLIHMYF